jgi:P4 family phage/plasmid primase-like protien
MSTRLARATTPGQAACVTDPAGNAPSAALRYAALGWPVFPCRAGQKIPATMHGVLDATTDPEQIRAWWAMWPAANVAIATGSPGPDVIDVDVKPDGAGWAAFAELKTAGLIDGASRYVQTPSGGLHAYYTGTLQRNGTIRGQHIDFRGKGGYVLAPPSAVGSKPYKALEASEPGTATADWRAIRALLEPPPQFTQSAHPAPGNGQERPGDLWAAQATWDDILLKHGWRKVRDLGAGHACWCRPGKDGPFTSATTREDGGLYVFSTSTPFSPEKPYSKFGAYAVLEHGGDHQAAARALRGAGYAPPPEQAPATAQDSEPGRLPRTQLDWGLRFAARQAGLHFVHGIGWHAWDGTRWKPDTDGEAIRAYSSMVKTAWAELSQITGDDDRKKAFKDLLAAERKPFAEGALWFAGADPRMAVAAELLDANRMLLNCANGTLDLATMHLRPHDPAGNITKVCRGAWAPGTGETRWAKFMAEILPDAGIRGFVQRLMGAALPGRIREHILPILTGTGSNGKSTFIEAVMHALGDYALQADPTLLMASRHDAHPTGQAALQSRRLAVCMETAQGRRLDAPTAKHLTGGDTITARYMRKDFFSFTPSHTIVMVTNHKPVVDGGDEALWRRLAVIPFEQTFSGSDAETGLKEQLESEPDAILSWMIEGWIAYTEQGLGMPNGVRVATDAYKADSDAVGRFTEECLYPTQFGTVPSSRLFAEWQKWCVANGEDPATQKAFSEELGRRGFVRKRTNRGYVFTGFTLLSSENDDGVQGSAGSAGSPHTRARRDAHTDDPAQPCTPEELSWN